MSRVRRVAQPTREYKGFKLGQPVYCDSEFNEKIIGACYIRGFIPKLGQAIISKVMPGKMDLKVTSMIDHLRKLTKEERQEQVINRL